MTARQLTGCFVVWVICYSIRSAHAVDYFVDPAGSDMATGSSSAPWKTLQHAADLVQAGDLVTVRPGNYVGFDLRTSGMLGAPIEFVAQPGVLINEPSRVRQRDGEFLDGINLEGASHVVIDGFNITGMPEAGVRSVGFSDDFASNVTVRNVTATNNGVWGIFTGHVDDLLIESNRSSGSLDEHGIYVSNSGDRPVIRNNVVFGNNGSGIHMNGDVRQGGDGNISNALVSGNIIYDNGTNGSAINMDGVQDSRIENNLIFNNHSSGISLYKIDAKEGSSGNTIINNTIHQANNGRWALNIKDGSTDATVLNNILISDHPFRGAINILPDSRSGFVSDYNAVIGRFSIDDGDSVMSLAEWRALPGNAGNDVNSFVATPGQLFQNPTTGDYHLLGTSPAINAGTSTLAPTFDFDGKSRPIGAAFDIGAYEFGVAVVSGDYNQNGIVDAADYTVWRDTLGKVGTGLAADGDGNSQIDAADYGVWKSAFVAGAAGASAAIPEPHFWTLLAAAVICAATVACGHRRKLP